MKSSLFRDTRRVRYISVGKYLVGENSGVGTKKFVIIVGDKKLRKNDFLERTKCCEAKMLLQTSLHVYRA